MPRQLKDVNDIKNNDTSFESTDNKQWIYEIFFMPYTVGTVECGDREIFVSVKLHIITVVIR